MAAKKQTTPKKRASQNPPLKIRPPVVAVLGHVDHGKTTLLDAIRQTNVVAGEHGGITQHIGAYQVTVPIASDQGAESKITFIDTPGHAAFSKMRARGAQVTDLALLVVAANDGVMPQTIEAIDHLRAAEVPLIVVVNKIDLPEAQPDQVYKQLAEQEVVVESYGGQVPAVQVSAIKKKGLNDLLEMILLVAGLRELKADPEAPLEGVVIESGLDSKKGPVATVLVREGILRIGETVFAGQAQAKIRALTDADGRRLQEARPSTPVEVLGFNRIPEVGVKVLTEPTVSSPPTKVQLPTRPARSRESEPQLIIRADTEGTKEAVRDAVERLKTDDLKLKVLSVGTGEITESDIFLAAASKAIIIGFNVGLVAGVKKLAEAEGVVIKIYKVIYELIEEVEAVARGFGESETEVVGQGEVLKSFQGTKATIAGVKVVEGSLSVGDQVRIKRDGVVIGEAKIATMRQLKKNVKRVKAGGECGLTFSEQIAFQPGDIVESYRDIK